MAALTTRKDARERLLKLFEESLDRIIPPEEITPLKGQTFRDFEDQVEAVRKTILPAILEERTALETTAVVEDAGHCPHCGSDRLYLEKESRKTEVIGPHGPVIVQLQRDAGVVAGLFPPQERALALPAEVPLTPRAAERLGREAAIQPFDQAAKALQIDWGMTMHGRQVQRWSQALGQSLVAGRDHEVLAYQERGVRPPPPPNEPQLLVIGLDGGRVQSREKNEQTDSRWVEDKVCTITTYLPGDGDETEARPLVTTSVATMRDSEAFGPMVRVEAERRGVRTALQILALCDGGNWIDPLLAAFFGVLVRIIDWCHASEHLWEAARAAFGANTAEAAMWGERWEAMLWNGKAEAVIKALTIESQRLGPPRDGDVPQHPRRVLAQNVGYFTKHKDHMRYPEYRAKGWPIGSGVTEAAVKQFNKRVKGTEQFWLENRVEPILMLRALWISQDERWSNFWTNRPAYVN